MNHFLLTLPFVFYGLAIIWLLAKTDPRRRQLSSKRNNTSRSSFEMSTKQRKWLAGSLALPFVPLFLLGNFAGVLMYAGALTVLGWLITELPASLV